MIQTRRASPTVLLSFLILFESLGSGLLTHSGFAAEKQSPKGFVLESIEGAKTVKVLKGPGGKEEKEITAGSELHAGERIKTNDQTSAVVLYPDGSRVTIQKNTDFEIEDKFSGTQWNRLREGQVHGVVPKVDPVPTKPRFLIRTKTAVMGVRGTDFVMALEKGGELAKVHTLEGQVMVAKNTTALLTGQGAPVSAGQFVEANSAGISPPKSFDTEQFMKNLQSGNGGAPAASNAAAGAGAPGVPGGLPGAPSAPGPSLGIGLPSAPAPSIAPPAPKLPPQQQAKLEEQKKKDEEENGRRIQLIALQVGALYAKRQSTSYRALSVAWTPSIPIPFTGILSARGAFGGSFFQNGSLNSELVIHDFQGFGVVTMHPFSFEAGGGWQFWRNRGLAAPIWTLEAVYHIGKRGFFDRIWASRSQYHVKPRLDEYKAGIGISF